MAVNHAKHNRQVNVNASFPFGGGRSIKLNGVTDDIAHITVTMVPGETVEIRDPTEYDNAWVREDFPSAGPKVDVDFWVPLGYKIRLGGYRQIRIMSFDGSKADFLTVFPESENPGP